MVLDLSKLPPFMPGIDLNRLYFQQVVKPLIDSHFPDLRYSAALIGEGSDVLRFDNPQSMDHNWGPHVRIFLNEEDFAQRKKAIDRMLRKELPVEFMGFPTNFTKPDERKYLVTQMKPVKEGPVNHMVEFYTIRSFWKHYLNYNPYKSVTITDWLTFPQQALLEVTAGEIYFDGLGELEKIRNKFSYYPDHVWIYLYMVQWDRIANAEAFVGRSGAMGDELGSSIIGTGIVHDLMKMCFYMEKKYYPYNKWFGTAFSRLRCAPELTNVFTNITHSKTWEEREEQLGRAYEVIVRMHNEMKVAKPLSTSLKDYNGRPYKVIDAHTAVHEIFKSVKDPFIRRLKYHLGSTDQFISHARINHINYAYWEFSKFLGKTDKEPRR